MHAQLRGAYFSGEAPSIGAGRSCSPRPPGTVRGHHKTPTPKILPANYSYLLSRRTSKVVELKKVFNTWLGLAVRGRALQNMVEQFLWTFVVYGVGWHTGAGNSQSSLIDLMQKTITTI